MSNSKPRILLVSDSVSIHTGFARVAREIALHLIRTGKYEVCQHGWYHRNPQVEVPIKIYPTKQKDGAFLRSDLYGEESFDEVCFQLQPDIVLGIGNFTMLRAITHSKLRSTYYLITYVPIDHFQAGVDKAWEESLGRVDDLYLYTPWARDVLNRNNPAIRVTDCIPHGVDPEVFRPRPKLKTEIRKRLGIPEDSFVVGYVGRNLERKRVDQVIRVAGHLRNGTYNVQKDGTCRPFFLNKYGEFEPGLSGKQGDKRNVVILAHVPSNDNEGPPLDPILIHYGMKKSFYVDTSYKVAEGVEDDKLALLYNAMDVQVSFATGGWELVQLEAMASGIPQLLGNWSAVPDFVEGALWVEASSWSSDLRAGCLRPWPDMKQALSHLRFLMDNPKERERMGEKAREASLRYNWKDVCSRWEVAIDKALAKASAFPVLSI